jgi:hypothetical protein
MEKLNVLQLIKVKKQKEERQHKAALCSMGYCGAKN